MAAEVEDNRGAVVRRVFDILDCFAGGAELGITNICEQTGLPPATVHRFLAALVTWGGVEKLGHGRYTLGSRIWQLGVSAPEMRELRGLAQPFLVSLHLETKGTVYLSVRDGLDAVFSDRITLVKSSTASSRASRRMPLEQSGGGRALLAHSPDAWRVLVARAQVEPQLAEQLPLWEKQLEDIRKFGVGITLNDSLKGRTSVAAPIVGSDGTLIASVTAAFPDTRIPDPTTIAPQVLATARAIAQELEKKKPSRTH